MRLSSPQHWFIHTAPCMDSFSEGESALLSWDNPTYSWCLILSVRCNIWLASILLRVFISMFLTEIVQLIASTLNFFLYFWETHTHIKWNRIISTHVAPVLPQVYSPLQLYVFLFYDPLNPATAAHMYIRVGLSGAARMCMGLGPATKAWDSYQWPHPQESDSPSPGSVHWQ